MLGAVAGLVSGEGVAVERLRGRRRSPTRASRGTSSPSGRPRVIVAIDGPAGAGKSTVARAVARRLGVAYLDTGAMYRALTWLARQRGIDARRRRRAGGARPRRTRSGIEPTDDGDRVCIAGRGRHRGHPRCPRSPPRSPRSRPTPGCARRWSPRSGRCMARASWVSDGRDVGTSVCPEADLKVFLTASLEERARRRHAELAARGVEIDPEDEVLEDVRRRDHSWTAPGPRARCAWPRAPSSIDSSALERRRGGRSDRQPRRRRATGGRAGAVIDLDRAPQHHAPAGGRAGTSSSCRRSAGRCGCRCRGKENIPADGARFSW